MLMLVLVSCGKKPKDLLARKWKFESRELSGIPESKKKDLEEMNAEMRKSTTFEFKSDGTYEFVMPGSTEKGQWTISDDGKSLKTKEGKDGKEESNNIEELSASKLILSKEQEGKVVKISFN